MTPTFVIYASLINWLVTTILVDSALFARPREWIVLRGLQVKTPWGWNKMPYIFPEGTTKEQVDASPILPYGWRGKLSQLVSCHMCMGTWVGFAEAVFMGGPFHSWWAVIANGLLFKAGGHLVLELRSTIAKP